MNGEQAYLDVQAGGHKAWRSVWPSPAAIANDNGVVDYWTVTNQGEYTLTEPDRIATDWVLEPDNGDRPPR